MPASSEAAQVLTHRINLVGIIDSSLQESSKRGYNSFNVSTPARRAASIFICDQLDGNGNARCQAGSISMLRHATIEA